jgi:hypothetical protein
MLILFCVNKVNTDKNVECAPPPHISSPILFEYLIQAEFEPALSETLMMILRLTVCWESDILLI